MSKSIYLIYKHTSPSGKSYIGLTNNYSRRCNEHKSSGGCVAFNNAIQKYGWENFHHEILIENLTLDEANLLEVQFIESHNTLYPNGYNLREGGSQPFFSDESRQKMSTSRKNTTTAIILETGIITRLPIDDPRWLTGEIVGATRGKKIGPQTPEQIQRRIQTLQRNNTKPSEQTKQNWSNTRKGKRPAYSIDGISLGLISIDDNRWDIEIFRKSK